MEMAPVPVPPPIPAVKKTISAPASADLILYSFLQQRLRQFWGLLLRQTSVSLGPSWILVGASWIEAPEHRICDNESTPSMPSSIMRLTAF
jgi:hypothetical protein